jgi:DNA-binding response OmpR family regulator
MRKKILLVDDSNTILMMERMILKQSPYDLVMASSGEEAVDKALAERPDVILMDVVMPGIDGFEACRRIRKQEAIAATPIIMVSTRGEATNVESGFASGCNDYVTKPINTAELLAKLRNALGE